MILRIRPVKYSECDRVFVKLRDLIEYKQDLINTGIDYINARGEYLDFHSFRYTFCTNLALNGVSIRNAMELMRHSDIMLTAKLYTDVGMLQEAKLNATCNLPNYLDIKNIIIKGLR